MKTFAAELRRTNRRRACVVNLWGVLVRRGGGYMAVVPRAPFDWHWTVVAGPFDAPEPAHAAARLAYRMRIMKVDQVMLDP